MDIKSPLERYKDIALNEQLTLNNEQLMKNIKESIEFLKTQNKTDYMFRMTLAPILTEEDIIVVGQLIKGAKCFQLQQFVPNEFSNRQKTVLLPYQLADAHSFQSILSAYATEVLLRGF